ncbi:MAG: cellulase family glycosylhydrolase [Cyclobacteriaceae bacterium]|nr:cellulase family glycosylhydrolase [Cyclobacteriaceae bacterium]
MSKHLLYRLNKIKQICLVFLLIPFCGSAQNFNRGVNLTNWFQAGSAREIQFSTFTRKDFEQIKSLGCDVIRLPINLHFMSNGAPAYQLDPLFLTFLDKAVDWAEELQLHLILDNHTFDPDVDTSPDVINPLKSTWAQMAQHFKNRSEYIYYEVLNEPHGIADAVWAQIQQQVIDTIRVHDTRHYIVVGGSGWNGYNNLAALPVYSDQKLIYTFHFYDPFIFTHQGATWGSPSMASLANVPFPFGTATMPAVPANLRGTWVESAIQNYSTEGTINKVRQLIDIAVAFKTQRNVPVFCGEFGVYIPNSNNTDRIRWYEVVRTYMEQKGISWTMWDYKGGFGLFKKNSGERFEYDINTALVEKLGLTVPPQQPYVRKPETTGKIVYDDYLGKDVYNASYRNGGQLDFYAPGTFGKFCLCWKDVAQYDAIGFDFRPDLDFSKLVTHDYELVFKVRSTATLAKFDVRFIDTKTGTNDRPWRMSKTIDAGVVPFNGQWQQVRIPLKQLTETGAWDGTWYNPQGLFDWAQIDRLEIVAEHQPLTGIQFCYDDIAIEGEDIPIEEVITNTTDLKQHKITVFPNPFNQELLIDMGDYPTAELVKIKIYNQQGVLLKTILTNSRQVRWDGTSEAGIKVATGMYVIRIALANGIQTVRVAVY